MKLATTIIVSFLVAFSVGARAAEPVGPATRSSPATRPSGEPDFWQAAPDGRGTILAYTERIAGDVKPLEIKEGAKPIMPPDAINFGNAKFQKFVTTFYMVGDGGTTIRLWTHRGIVTTGAGTPMKIYAALLTSNAFLIVYEDQLWGIFAAAVRPGAEASASDYMSLRGFGLTRASIAGPLKDGTFSVVVGDDFRPQNRYHLKFNGNDPAWEWDGIWNAAGFVWRNRGPESRPIVLPKRK
ncbi:MAG TPA: hypothetical protein VG326_16110 [Tepidisphaeraceae bacterium]|jgi:hypothetical protein|nr:hypothetical protein [Tepidisphaeraceae bacterium]